MNQRTAKALDSLAGATVIAIRQLGLNDLQHPHCVQALIEAREELSKALVTQVLKPHHDEIESAARNERELCKRDVCMYCGGRAMNYHLTPEGPNDAGNYVHHSKSDRRENDTVLCQASSIFSREAFNQIT